MYNIGDTKGGLSGANIYRDGNVVYKTADNTETVAQWYTLAKSSSLKTPNVLNCLLYTSPSPRDRQKSRMPSSA